MIDTMRGFELKSSQFRGEREAAWRDLERLVTHVEAHGVRSLSAAELHQLPSLYRAAASSLSVARAISLDKNLLAYLTALVGRAHLCVYGPTRRTWDVVRDFFARRWPRTVRRHAPLLAAAWVLLLLGILTGFALTRSDPDAFFTFVPEELAQGRGPAAATAELRAALYQRENGWSAALPTFASVLFSHNARLSLQSFAAGLAAGVPVVYLLFSNGLGLGALAAIYDERGLGLEFWAWILPHGVSELGALCLSGAAGLALGGALLFPGRRTRLEALARRGREAALLAIGAVVMLLFAGLIEGIFRQLVMDVRVRWLVAGVSLLGWVCYFLFAGRDDERTARG